MSFWKNKRVLLTGHTGFKGSWLSLWLHQLGAKTTGLALAPDSTPNLFTEARVNSLLQHQLCNLQELSAVKQCVRRAEPEVVFHLAAQPLVRQSYLDPRDTYATNVMGTLHLFEALREVKSVQSIVVITTDKVYENPESSALEFRESDKLGGHDPYSSSKACAEILSASYYRSFFEKAGVGLATARAGNVIGGGDWAKDRILTDAMLALKTGGQLTIRNPQAVRPWQHVLEPLSGYLTLAENLHQDKKRLSKAFNFGPGREDQVSVQTLLGMLSEVSGKKLDWKQEPANLHEAQNLRLNTERAESELSWKPKLKLRKSLEITWNWFSAYWETGDAQKLCLQQIGDYQNGK